MSSESQENAYRGWRLTFNPARPVTGLWRAEQAGVTLSARTRSGIYLAIDDTILERRRQAQAQEQDHE